MANEIIDKLYIIVEEAKKGNFDNAIKFADSIAKKELEEFSYIRNNKVQYCEWQTVREYIYFARDIGALTNDLKVSDEANYNSAIGFKSWIGDVLLEYLEEKGFSLAKLQSSALSLISAKKLPTTELLFGELDPNISEKHFRWSLTVLQSVKPLTINVCRKWIWIPANTFEF